MAQHLVMAGRLIDDDPELAYEHAQAAVRRAGRVDVVREAAALTAYATGRFGEALRELRTVRRLSGVDAHRAIEADCERGLGRPDRALALAAAAPEGMSHEDRVELAIVEAGARSDLGELEAALSVLERLDRKGVEPETLARVDEAHHDVLVALGRAEPRDDAAAGSDGALQADGLSSSHPDEQHKDDQDRDVLGIDDLNEQS